MRRFALSMLVLLIPVLLISGCAHSMKCGAEMKATMNIVEAAAAEGNLTTLVSSIETAGLVETLSGEGPFTLFAPSDEAFANMGMWDRISGNQDILSRILKRHVVSGKVMAADLEKMESVKPLEGDEIKVECGEEGIKVGNATVVKSDINCTNGVIYVIDSLLMSQMRRGMRGGQRPGR